MEEVIIYCCGRWFNAVAGYALQTGNILHERGFKVTFIVRHGSPLHKKLTKLPFELYFQTASGLLPELFRIRRLIKHRNIKNCLVFTSNGAIIFGLLRFFLSGLRVFRFRGDATAPKSNPLSKQTYSIRFIDGLFFPSEYAKSLCRKIIASDVPTAIIQYPLQKKDVNIIGSDREIILKTHHIPAGRNIFCLLGRNQAVKGHIDLIRAFTRSNFDNGHLIFLIKDLNEFPDELKLMKQLIQENRLQQHVTILGHVDNLSEILSVVDCGVIPSLGSEAICRAAVEFFAHGVPAIVYPVGSLPEVLNHGHNGLICADKTPEALSEQLTNFNNLPENTLIRMRLNARETWRTEHSEPIFFKRLNTFARLSSGKTGLTGK